MTTIVRRPLSSRQPDQAPRNEKLLSPFRGVVRPGLTVKRPRSPEGEDNIHSKRSKTQSTVKTACTKISVTPSIKERKEKGKDKDLKDREQLRETRQKAREDFVLAYTQAFPSFVFFFDERDGSRPQMVAQVVSLGARTERFFSASVTHVITNRPQPPKNEQYEPSNKENIGLKPQKGNNLKSPTQLKSRFDHDVYDNLIRDAVQLNKKIWNFTKLESMLRRLLPQNPNVANGKGEDPSPALDQLLENERIHGTLERDPREKRHDYAYFSKSSYFLLIEDIKNELAPIAIMEYAGSSRATGADKTPSYPVLYMDPRARSPYTKFDEKEVKRLEKAELNDRIRELERETHRAKVKALLKQQHLEAQKVRKQTSRRRASMSNLEIGRGLVLGTDDGGASGGTTVSNSLLTGGNNEQIASGYGPSTTGIPQNAYLAASGNSVAITSTTTTSLAKSLAIGTTRLPANLRQQLGRQVLMNKRTETKEKIGPFEQRLRKAKSTTTMRLPAREESKKPGYCEACRVKFEDFGDHIKGTRHRKFAMNDSNYIDLDFLLRRLQRKGKYEPNISSPASSMIDVDSQRDDSPDLNLSDSCLIPGDYFYIGSDEEKEHDEYMSDRKPSENEEDEDEDEENQNNESGEEEEEGGY